MRTISLNEAIQDFINISRLQGKAKNTIYWYQYLLRDFSKWFSGNLQDITKETIYNYFNYMLSRGLKQRSIITYWTGLRAFLKYCYREGYLPYDVTKEVKLKNPPKQYPYILTEEQVDRLLRAIDKTTPQGLRNYAIVLTFLDTGIRLSELINARIKDLDLTRRSLKIRGKGDKDRIVFFGRKLKKILLRYLERRGYLTPDDPLFCNTNGSPLNPRDLQRMIERLAKRAGLKGVKVSPHVLRHTFATLYIKNGGDVFSLQQLLGHSSITTCMVYVFMAGRNLKEAYDRHSPIDRL
jgi:integrase/recombinase XerD